jgi:putative addiction module component (TIGR02574 family)
MSLSTEQLLTSALELLNEDRLKFVEALIASLRSVDLPPFSASWGEVICRRSEELHSGQVKPVPWAEVKRQAREKTGD